MRYSTTLTAALVLLAAASPPTALAAPPPDSSGPGFKLLGSRPVPTFGAVYATLRTGEVFQFDGQLFELYARDGTLIATLGDLGSFVFPSFALIDPSGSFAVVGESSNGDILRVDLSGAGFQTVANAFFNYDAEFDALDPDALWVSAATGGFGNGNDLLHVHIPSGTATLVAHVDAAASGPLEVDAQGDVVYADVPEDLCPIPGQTEVVRWSRADLLSGQVRTIADATLLAAGFDGGSSLERDPVSGSLLLAENDFCAPFGRVVAVDLELGGRGALLVESTSFVSTLEVFAGPGAASLQPYQPANVRLSYASTDFGAGTADRFTLVPRRARASVEPPASYPGIVTVTIRDAAPNAGVLMLWALERFQLEHEQAHQLGFGFPVFFAAPLDKLRRFPFPVATDAEGSATFGYFDDGSLAGNFLLQGFLLGSAGQALGTTTPALN